MTRLPSWPGRCCGRVAVMLAVMLLGLTVHGTGRGAESLSGPQVKAWFVVNFLKFTVWPESQPSTVEVCTLGQDATVPALHAFEGRRIDGITLHIRTAVTVPEAHGCHVMYVAGSESRRVSAITKALAPQAILTISDIEGFIDEGGMIGLVPQDDRYVFEVNLDAAHGAGLTLGTPMLRLARRVINTKAH
jgi:hypothetical protein